MNVTYIRSPKWSEESYAAEPIGGSAKLTVCAGHGFVWEAVMKSLIQKSPSFPTIGSWRVPLTDCSSRNVFLE